MKTIKTLVLMLGMFLVTGYASAQSTTTINTNNEGNKSSTVIPHEKGIDVIIDKPSTTNNYNTTTTKKKSNNPYDNVTIKKKENEVKMHPKPKGVQMGKPNEGKVTRE